MADAERTQAVLAELRQLTNAAAGLSLPEALDRAERRRQVRVELRHAEDQLLRLADRRPLAEFAAAAAAADPAELASREETLTRDLQPLNAEIEQLSSEWGIAEQEVRKLEAAGADAAEREQRAQELIAAAGDQAQRYAALRAAELLLRRGAERQRAQAEGRLLACASQRFAALSAGHFSGLEPDRDDRGEFLAAVRADGVRVPPAALSEGAKDQFYLALRLAGLEERLDAPNAEPFPLIVDDLLPTFDDERATAAFGVFAELSAKTQVIFLTHHAHLVELARKAIPADRLFVHDLHEAAAATPAPPPKKPSPRRKPAADAAAALFAET